MYTGKLDRIGMDAENCVRTSMQPVVALSHTHATNIVVYVVRVWRRHIELTRYPHAYHD